MKNPIRILILEDQTWDLDLTLMHLSQAGFDPIWTCVDKKDDYLAHLHDDLEIILADFQLPQFNALHALQYLKESRLDIPFIVVSGTISEEVAVQCMKLGAADYLLKDRMTRLGWDNKTARARAGRKKVRRGVGRVIAPKSPG